MEPNERSPLLLNNSRSRIRMDGGAPSPRIPQMSRNHSYTGMTTTLESNTSDTTMSCFCQILSADNCFLPGSVRQTRHHSRQGSWGQRLMQSLSDRNTSMSDTKASTVPDERVWYDQFTSTDWVHDTIADSHRVKALRSRKDFWGRVRVMLDGCQGWILSAVCGLVIAIIAYAIDVAEVTIFDFKDGYCSTAWYLNEKVRRQYGMLSLKACQLMSVCTEMLPTRSMR